MIQLCLCNQYKVLLYIVLLNNNVKITKLKTGRII